MNLIGKNKRDVWDVNFVALCPGRCGACWEEHLAEVLAGTRETAKGSSTTLVSVRVFIPVGWRWSVTDWADGVFHRCLICLDSQGHNSQMKKASWWEGVARCRENALFHLAAAQRWEVGRRYYQPFFLQAYPHLTLPFSLQIWTLSNLRPTIYFATIIDIIMFTIHLSLSYTYRCLNGA